MNTEHYTRRKALYKLREVIMRDDGWVDNPRAGYWEDLIKIKDALKELAYHQNYEDGQDEKTRMHNEKAEKEFKGY